MCQVIIAKFEKTDCVKDTPKCGAPKVVTNDENMDLVAAAYVQSPKNRNAKPCLNCKYPIILLAAS